MRLRIHLLCSTLLCAAGCGRSAPAYDETSYEPGPASSGAIAPAPAATEPQDERTIGDKIRQAELEAQYQGVGDAPSPYATQDQLATGSEAYASSERAHEVQLNGVQLGEPDFRELEVRTGMRPEAGHYWYDARSGLWGLIGHGPGGLTHPGLRAAELPRDASAGTSKIVINGRALTRTEERILLELLGWPADDTAAYAGSYTLDADGKLHRARGRYLGNLATRATRARASGKYADLKLACALALLGSEPGPLGRSVSVNCD